MVRDGLAHLPDAFTIQATCHSLHVICVHVASSLLEPLNFPVVVVVVVMILSECRSKDLVIQIMSIK